MCTLAGMSCAQLESGALPLQLRLSVAAFARGDNIILYPRLHGGMKCIPFYGPGWAELGANGDSAQEAKSDAHAGPNSATPVLATLDDAHVPACLAYRRRPSISYCRAMRKMHAHQQMLLHEMNAAV